MMTKEFTRSASNENTYLHPLPDPAILPAANRRAWPAIYVSRPCGALDSAGDEHGYEMNTPFPVEIAEGIFWFHVVVIAFAVFGLVAIPLGAWSGWKFVRVFWWRAMHLGLLGIVALQALLGRACFLTIWESEFLRRAGEAASNEPLVQRWVSQAVYWPLPLWFFAILYVAVYGFTLLLWWLFPPSFPQLSRSA